MPKIILKNGDTGKLEEFEPVDAREVLSNKNTIYSVPKETRDGIGLTGDPLSQQVNIPQIQGDPEMQTGLPIEKYRREAVVKAQVGMPHANVDEALSAGTRTAESAASSTADDVEHMTVAQLKESLSQRGVEYHAGANKADLQKLMRKSHR